MKIVSTLKNTKADRETKLSNLRSAHQRIVRYKGELFRICVASLGSGVLASAEPVKFGGRNGSINLFDTSAIAKDLRKLCENRLYS